MSPELESLLTDVADAFRSTDTSLPVLYLASWLEADELLEATNVVGEDLSFAEVTSETALPRQINEESFSHWGSLHYMFEEDEAGVGATIDVFVAVVEVDGELRVG